MGVVVRLMSVLRVLVSAGLLTSLAAGLPGCTEEIQSHSVRGQVVRVADGGRSLVIDHEQIPGVMSAMQMSLPVLDSTREPEVRQGDKIRFDLHLQDGRASISGIEKLPPETVLAISAGGAHGTGTESPGSP